VKNGKQVLRGVLRIKFGNLNIFIKKNNMVQPKYSPEEALQRVKLMMGYDTKKTLKENVEEIGVVLNEQETAGNTANIVRDITHYLMGDVQSSDLNNIQGIIDDKVIGKTFKDGTCLMSKVIEYFGRGGNSRFSDNFTTLAGFSGTGTDLIKSIQATKEAGESEFEDVKKDLVDSINKELNGFCKTGAKKDETKKDETKKDEKVKTGGGGGTKQAPKIPAELKDIDGVKKFQDWLDKNKAGWATGFSGGVLNQAGGYGRFGPRTTRAWNSYGQEYLKGGTSKPEEKPEVGGEVQNVNATSTDF